MAQGRGFKSVKLLGKVPIGIGSYGSVFKVQCDDLVCAAKVLHPTLITEDPHARSPQGKFLGEIDFLSTLRHPNVVQYLGVRQDPTAILPMLLMELMDESLTHFLESSHSPLPFHGEVNICHDIALALSFLHSNGITHRDLSSNNVLMLGDRRAKVTDFGMAKIRDQIRSSRFTRQSNTQCPGTDVYMPPEALEENPKYTEKIDCFSFGVLAIQITTRKFPSPGKRTKTVTVAGRKLLEKQTEFSRREADIMMVPKCHLLLEVARDCLKEDEGERPTASELCTKLLQLKEDKQYTDFSRVNLKQRLKEKEEDMATLVIELEAQNKTVSALHEKVQSLNEVTGIQATQIKALEEKLENAFTESNVLQRVDNRLLSAGSRSLNWRKGPDAPCPITRSCDAVVCGSFVYIVHQTTKSQLYVYNCVAESWSELPDCPTLHCSLANVKNSLVVIGGFQKDGEKTDKLYTLTTSGGHYTWREDYPPMPSKRDSVMTASYGSYLIVLGGVGKVFTKTVEILAVDSKSWSVAASLLGNLYSGSAAICGDQLFVLGGWVSHTTTTYSAMTCSLRALVSSCKPLHAEVEERPGDNQLDEEDDGARSRGAVSNVWHYCPTLTVTRATCISYHDKLLVFGGQDQEKSPCNTALTYDIASNSWIKYSHFQQVRSQCIVAVLPSDELMVLGGYTGKNFTKDTNGSEIGRPIAL